MQPLGEIRPVPIDVRVVVAGQQPLIEAVRAGRFRADLLARLDGLAVRLPPLRARREDVLPLFSHLLEELGQGRAPSMESDFAERLCMHDWPFNVRELVLLAKRLRDPARQRGDLARPAPARADCGRRAGAPLAGRPPRRRRRSRPVRPRPPEPVELPALVVALRASGGNVARAAAMLGISRQRAYRLMEGQAVDLGGAAQARGAARMTARRRRRPGRRARRGGSTGSSACWRRGGWASSTRRSTPSCGGASR